MDKNVDKNIDNNTNLDKSSINDQIETINDEVKLTKREQFLNLIGVNIGEEFYIDGEEKNLSYLIYHFTNDLHLLARSSNDKDGILGWCTATSIGKLLDENVKLIKIKK